MKELYIPQESTKDQVFQATEAHLGELSLKFSDVDNQRPWGGFFVINPADTDAFIDEFFPEVNKDDIYQYGEQLGPKLLIVEPNQKLSWQYHNRRAELWKAVQGPVGVMVSDTDEKPELADTLHTGEVVQHGNQVRHRLIGLSNWGIVAEIWQHTDPENPTDESDIVRLEDNYGRAN